jgi:hypothetical protein
MSGINCKNCRKSFSYDKIEILQFLIINKVNILVMACDQSHDISKIYLQVGPEIKIEGYISSIVQAIRL